MKQPVWPETTAAGDNTPGMRHLIVLVLFALLGCTQDSPEPPRVEKGVIDLSAWNFEEAGAVALNGEWIAVPDALYSPEELAAKVLSSGTIDFQVIPSPFGRVGRSPDEAKSTSYITYSLRLVLPAEGNYALKMKRVYTAYKVWANDSLVASAGVVGKSVDAQRPDTGTEIWAFQAHTTDLRLVIQVSNFQHRHGGITGSIEFGPDSIIRTDYEKQLAIQVLLAGGLFFLGLYYCIWFANRSREFAAVIFGMICLIASLRMASTNDKLLEILVPIGYESIIRIEYLTFYAGVCFLLMLLRSLFPEEYPRPVIRVMQILSTLYCLIVVATPHAVFTYTIPSFEIITIVALAFALWALVRAIRYQREGARRFMVGLIVIAGAAANDILFAKMAIHTGNWTPLAVVMFVMIQSQILSARFANAFRRVETLSVDLAASNAELRVTNEAVQRFVPFEFTSLLHRASIRDVQRGDSTTMTAEILFCDVRNFTTLAENMPASQTFAVINDWLAHAEPAITEHGGFVNQFLGDCIMALYASGADEAVRSGIAILRALDDFNTSPSQLPGTHLQVGIGINSGPVMLGTIGGADRLDSGIVGDAVNVAARVESMTKLFGTQFLITEATLKRLANPSEFSIREIDRLVAKGKSDAIRVFEILDAVPDPERETRKQNGELFAAGLDAYRAGGFLDALAMFKQCVSRSPNDGAAQLYVRRCTAFVDDPPADWNGVSVLNEK